MKSNTLTDLHKEQITRNELQQWEAEKYRLELRARVFKNTGQKEQLNNITEKLADIEASIDVLQSELKELAPKKTSD